MLRDQGDRGLLPPTHVTGQQRPGFPVLQARPGKGGPVTSGTPGRDAGDAASLHACGQREHTRRARRRAARIEVPTDGHAWQGQFLTRILAQYPAILDLATYLSLNKLLGRTNP